MESILLSKNYKGHDIQMLVVDSDNIVVTHIQCLQCEIHKHYDGLPFEDQQAMLFLDAELQMHSAGVSEGWSAGLSFMGSDDESND